MPQRSFTTLVSAVAIASIANSCSNATAQHQAPPSPLSEICEAYSADSAGSLLAELEKMEGEVSLIDDEMIQQCVDANLRSISDDIDEYCSGRRQLSEDDPVAELREADIQRKLVLAYRELVWECRSNTSSSSSSIEHEHQDLASRERLEAVSREWCSDVPLVFDQFDQIARAQSLGQDELKCLGVNRQQHVAEMDALCRTGWESIADGPRVIYRWYASCGVAREFPAN